VASEHVEDFDERHVLAGLCVSVGDREIEGVDLLRYDGEGRVAELVVMLRPATALMAVRDAVAAGLQAAAATDTKQ